MDNTAIEWADATVNPWWGCTAVSEACKSKSNVPGIGWVIAGGASGSRAAPSHPAWYRSLRDQCVEAGVPFMFKQWGEWGLAEGAEGARRSQLDGAVLEKVGKKAAGRLLDGRTWDQFPAWPVEETRWRA